MKRNKMLLSAIGMGVTYLMRNKHARNKVIGTVKSFFNKQKTKPRME
ncbi:hypothetical protein KP806_19070 [Paenibacillus sp. N4]|nr:hypothetical protein [Paenibacillus vietnamensis]MCA0757169.1 hypothetical protein [Paenibacillus vietnamensis]